MPWDDDPNMWSGYGNKPGQDDPVSTEEDQFNSFQRRGVTPAQLNPRSPGLQGRYAEWLKNNPAPEKK